MGAGASCILHASSCCVPSAPRLLCCYERSPRPGPGFTVGHKALHPSVLKPPPLPPLPGLCCCAAGLRRRTARGGQGQGREGGSAAQQSRRSTGQDRSTQHSTERRWLFSFLTRLSPSPRQPPAAHLLDLGFTFQIFEALLCGTPGRQGGACICMLVDAHAHCKTVPRHHARPCLRGALLLPSSPGPCTERQPTISRSTALRASDSRPSSLMSPLEIQPRTCAEGERSGVQGVEG